MIPGVELDHISLAAFDRADLDRRYGGDLGATYVTQGATAGLYATILRCDNGVKLETIEPHEADVIDYLVRFLERHGPGVHHLTFVVPDVGAAGRAAQAAGYRLVGSHTEHLVEVFLHPKDAHGVVVQFVERRDYGPGGTPPEGWPVPSRPPADLDHLALVVGSLADARRLYVDLFGGQADEVGALPELGGAADALDVRWTGPGCVRLVEAVAGSALDRWLAGRPGAVHHLAFTVEDPPGVPGARAAGDGRWEVPAEENFGVALHLRAR